MVSLYELFIGVLTGLLVCPLIIWVLTNFFEGLNSIIIDASKETENKRFAVYCLMAVIGVLMFVYL